MTWNAFIISLDEHKTRRAPLIEQLTTFGIPFEVLSAVDSRAGVPEKYREFVDHSGALRDLGRPMSNGEFGCALSHQLAYRQVIERGLAGALIFEDDAVLLADAADCLRSAFYEKYDFVQFNHGFARILRFGIGRVNECPGIATERLLANSGMTTGYSVSPKACRFIMSNSLPITIPADWPCDLMPLKPRITCPRLVTAPVEQSGQSILMDERNKARTGYKLPTWLLASQRRRVRNPKGVMLRWFGVFYAKTLTEKIRPRLWKRILGRLMG